MARQTTPENPYLAARQEWNERYGSYVKAAAAWRIVGITGMALAVIATSYALYQSTQVKLVLGCWGSFNCSKNFSRYRSGRDV